jgi:hypothetical protein
LNGVDWKIAARAVPHLSPKPNHCSLLSSLLFATDFDAASAECISAKCCRNGSSKIYFPDKIPRVVPTMIFPKLNPTPDCRNLPPLIIKKYWLHNV